MTHLLLERCIHLKIPFTSYFTEEQSQTYLLTDFIVHRSVLLSLGITNMLLHVVVSQLAMRCPAVFVITLPNFSSSLAFNVFRKFHLVW